MACVCSTCFNLGWIDVPETKNVSMPVTSTTVYPIPSHEARGSGRVDSSQTDTPTDLHSPTPEAASMTALYETLRSGTNPEKKQAFGECLFPLTQHLLGDQSSLAGKVTGMLLELENSKLLRLLESSNELKAIVSEALEVLSSAEPAVRIDHESSQESALTQLSEWAHVCRVAKKTKKH